MIRFGIPRLIRKSRFRTPTVSTLRQFHHEFTNSEKERIEKENNQDEQIPAAMRRKYKVFRDEDSPEIFDVEEERQRYQIEDKSLERYTDDFLGLNLKRGITGVFEIEDLVDVLRKEQAEHIFVCRVPTNLKYVDYMTVVTARNYRHMVSVAEFTRRVFKMKRSKGDIIPKIEGEKSREWKALDLGNITLHIFSPDAREMYDLESLWSIGAAYDNEYNKPKDNLVDIFERSANLFENKNHN